MKWRRLLCAPVAVLLVFATAACAQTRDRAGSARDEFARRVTLDEAREFQNALLVEMMAFVPETQIIDDFGGPIEKSRAMTCDWLEQAENPSHSESGVFLPGRSGADVAPDTDLDEVRERIAAEFGARGWAVEREPEVASGELLLTSPDGYRFHVDAYTTAAETLRFSISSFSPCIEAPHDFDIFEQH